MTIEELPPPSELELKLYRAGLRNARKLLPVAAALLTNAGRPRAITEAFKVKTPAVITKLRKALGLIAQDHEPIAPEMVAELRRWAGVEKEPAEEEKPARPLKSVSVPRETDEAEEEEPSDTVRQLGESRADYIRRRAASLKR